MECLHINHEQVVQEFMYININIVTEFIRFFSILDVFSFVLIIIYLRYIY